MTKSARIGNHRQTLFFDGQLITFSWTNDETMDVGRPFQRDSDKASRDLDVCGLIIRPCWVSNHGLITILALVEIANGEYLNGQALSLLFRY
jgi:hypothetical protein